MRRINSQSVILAILITILCLCSIVEAQILSSAVRIGTLRLAEQTVIFECDGKDEIFDLSAKAHLIASGVDFPGVPGLREIGFKSQTDRIYLYGKQPKSAFILELADNDPNEKIRAVVYEGITGEKIEVNITGKTNVVRVDLEISNMPQKITLWKRLRSEK